MNQNLPETPTKIPSNINNNAMQLTIPTVFLDKTAKAAAKQSKEKEFLQKKQDVKKSIANIVAILRIINTELQYEQDQKTFTVLTQQQEVFEKILTQKKKNKKKKKQQKQQEKEKEKEKYREKRLIIQVEKETAKDFDSYILRNQINDRFFTKANIDQSVIATAIKFFTSQSIILTTMPDFSADFLLQKKTIWKDIFSNKAQNIEKDRQ